MLQHKPFYAKFGPWARELNKGLAAAPLFASHRRVVTLSLFTELSPVTLSLFTELSPVACRLSRCHVVTFHF